MPRNTHYINPHEVLEYLNELGYRNISRQQLKEFITDLKKLIKYDQRIEHPKQTELENTDPDLTNRRFDIFSSLYESATTSSKAKQVPKKEKIISVQIKKPPTKCCLKSRETCSKFDENFIQSKSDENFIRRTKDLLSYKVEDDDISENSENYTNQRPHSVATGRLSTKESYLQPKASFIRPRAKSKPLKSDPVALYHQYQAEWKRQKIPGQDNHANLRWIIREKMLGERDVVPNVPSINRFKKKPCTRV